MRRAGAAALLAIALASAPRAAAAPPDSGAAAAGGLTRSRLSDLPGAARAVAGDAVHVYTAPARIRRGTWPWIAGAAAVGGAVFAFDQELFDGAQRSKGDALYDAVLGPGRALEPLGNMGETNVYWFTGLALGHATGVAPLREITGEIIESHLLGGGIRRLCEVAIGRSRPFNERGPRHFEWNGGSSVPSGHTSVAFELATIASHHARHPAVTVGGYALATAIGLERVDSGAHWPSDVVAGAIVGTLVARTVVRRHAARAAGDGSALTWSPWLGPRGGVRGVRVAVALPAGD